MRFGDASASCVKRALIMTRSAANTVVSLPRVTRRQNLTNESSSGRPSFTYETIAHSPASSLTRSSADADDDLFLGAGAAAEARLERARRTSVAFAAPRFNRSSARPLPAVV